jgi:predicted SAM-dependent methyltransferase
MKAYLNLGCGLKYHPDWTNVDATSTSPHVDARDLSLGIPFPDSSFEVVYHSHLLEHFPRHKALRFVQECYRVLKPTGIIRVAVPDLEGIVRTYLQALEKALGGEETWKHNYEWLMLELYDQTVRERSGGAMLDYLKRDLIPNETFIYERFGGEAHRIMQTLRSDVQQKEHKRSRMDALKTFLGTLGDALRARYFRWLLGDEGYKAWQIGRFRLAGEVHQWMYDRYSLSKLLFEAGFQNSRCVGPTESRIPNWTSFHLDTEPDGSIYKPDSLYMEAMRP